MVEVRNTQNDQFKETIRQVAGLEHKLNEMRDQIELQIGDTNKKVFGI